MSRVILLDRDGVINVDSPDYIKTADEWQPIPGSLDAIRRFNAAGYKVGVCTNQSGVGRGLMSATALSRIHAKMARELDRCGGWLDAVLFCPHAPEVGCSCRKPAPGMLRDALVAFAASPEDACFVGDSERDLQAALAATIEPLLVRTGNGTLTEQTLPQDHNIRCFDDLAALADGLLDDQTGA